MLNQNYFFNKVNAFPFSFFIRRKAQYYHNSLPLHIILFDYLNMNLQENQPESICVYQILDPNSMGQWLLKTSGSLIA